MAWLLAHEGLGQITPRDFRTPPSPVVSDAQLGKALYLVLPDGRALPGFEAYRSVVLRVPGLWWLVPFYVPVASRLFGHLIYNWSAAHRGRLAELAMNPPEQCGDKRSTIPVACNPSSAQTIRVAEMAIGEVMTEIASGWDLVAQKTRRPMMHMLLIALQMLMLAEPMNRSRVTFTVRHRGTGQVRRVTAASYQEAADKIVSGQFDGSQT